MKNLWILLLIFFLILSSGCQGNSSSYDQENQIILNIGKNFPLKC